MVSRVALVRNSPSATGQTITNLTNAGAVSGAPHDRAAEIAVSANEIRRLFASLTRPPLDEQHIRHWCQRIPKTDPLRFWEN
ncbi:hypothetical protein GCM10018955_05410 [Planomonospora venezuelensis]